MLFSDKRLLNYSQRLQRLRVLAIGFLLCLLLPLSTLLFFGYQQLEKNLLSEYQTQARNFVLHADRALLKRRMLTNTLPIDAFEYYQQSYNPLTKLSEQVLSPLSRLELSQTTPAKPIRGLLGYFQYNNQAQFNSPVWPEYITTNKDADNKISSGNKSLAKRHAVALKLYQIVSKSAQIQQLLKQDFIVDKQLFNVTFDTPDHLIFYRIVTNEQQNYLQGYVVERHPYLSELFSDFLQQRHFNSAVLAKLEYQRDSTKPDYFLYQRVEDGTAQVNQLRHGESQYQQQLIYNSTLHWPYDGYRVTLTSQSLPMTPAMIYSCLFMAILIIAIHGACYGFYRLGLKQLALGEQRLNFVSSVSHELKTPLTSIRMYSQMLKEGTVLSDEFKKEYYEFIYGESERLTRLIDNILQLSKLSNHQQTVHSQYTQLTVLQDIIRSKTSSIIDKNKFQQNITIEIENPEQQQIYVEKDAFCQVIINITDNAVKFFDQDKINDVERQRIDFIFRQHPNNQDHIQLEIRDYGEGISQQQEDKIFDLFYRGGNELTRKNQGTGIGLALVNELVLAQQGAIEVKRKDPGLAFLLSFKSKTL